MDAHRALRSIGRGVGPPVRKLQARAPQGVLFMRRNRVRLACCFWGIGLLRSLGTCRRKGGGGALSVTVLFFRAPPPSPPRAMPARLRIAGYAFARAFKSLAAIAQLGERQTEDLKVPGSIPGLGIGICALHPCIG